MFFPIRYSLSMKAKKKGGGMETPPLFCLFQSTEK